ncbi:predicted protein [Naegleria gruberi]|uniref:ATP-dependent (S)-NAD(P)H-hydrate dehydratase n=1 Tax=Naegleria gruberi TaxID=5762 RepID=D2VCY7_NAEGR|nr:uncharacterized protein NAEGRDRAFT_32974 [Naegleria gruberi]EFC45505.1 predicted protein [Naegleria gruberi]|eukprot:XP_002678249.1 predicted protein [Naegleria gruberi strain NEG-M]
MSLYLRSSGIVLSQLRQFIIPPLTHHFHKGEAGRVVVIGGCEEYTGAPYYAAISALKTGADLSFVICSKSALMIKNYSPELVVYPYLFEKSAISYGQSEASIPSIVVLGPGLGRSKEMLQQAEWFIEYCKELNMPLVLDGDGLFLIGENPALIVGHSNVVLTPNPAEFSRLLKSVVEYHNSNNENKVSISQFKNETEEIIFVSKTLGDVCIVRKGMTDIIAKGDKVLECDIFNASPRRCGGQGDVLSGVIATFCFWANRKAGGEIGHDDRMLAACYGGCLVTKKAAELAFHDHHRATTTPNIIEKIGQAFCLAFKEDDN